MDAARSRVSFEEGRLGSLAEDADFQDGYFAAADGTDEDDEGDEGDTVSPYSNSRRRASLSIRIPPSRITSDIAFTALQYLPMPILVLSSEKTVVLANEAMGRLLGIQPGYEQDEEDANMGPLERLTSREEAKTFTDILYGTTLAQLGFDLFRNGSAVFVAWEEFLDTIFDDASRAQCSTTQLNTFHSRARDKDVTPTGSSHKRSVSAASSGRLSQMSGTRAEVHDAAVDVVFSTHRDSKNGVPLAHRNEMADHVQAQMIVSVWATEDEQYFTLTFTASRTDSAISSPPSSEGTKATSRTVSRTATSYSAGARSGLSSSSSSSSRSDFKKGRVQSPPSTTFASPTHIPTMDFPPRGPPAKASQNTAPSMFSKSNKLKEALLNSMNMPAYAMWKDESFGVPNKAAIKLLYPWIEDGQHDSSEQARDFLARYTLYRDDFSEEIPMEEFPIYRLMRLQQRFEGYRVGMYSVKDGSQMVFDTSGEPLKDDKGEFLGGVVLFHDVTDYARTINRERTKNERQFENICNMVRMTTVYTDNTC